MATIQSLSIDLKEESSAPTFCNHVGSVGVGLYLLALAIAGVHLYIAAEYTYYFQDLHREGVWVFFALTSIFGALVIYHCVAWEKIAKEEMCPTNEAPKTLFQQAKAFNANFGINGKWFLNKMYASEVLESATQVYNTIELYTCTLPPGMVLLLCFLLCLDHGHRCYAMWQPNTVQRRDRQVLSDLSLDLLCMVLPLTFSWFGYSIPLTVWEMTLIVLMPSIFTVMKLDELMEQNVRRRVTMEVIGRQNKRSTDVGRRRSSLFRKSAVEVGVEEQAKAVGRWTKYATSGVTMLSGLFFFVTGIVSVSVAPACDRVLWDACDVRVPLCSFRLSCNCAVLRMKNHNMTSLPSSIETMAAMRMLQINHGPLQRLPELGDMMPRLSVVNVKFNALSTLPASLGSTPNLVMLYAMFNQLSTIPDEIFQHSGIVEINVCTNNLTHLPEMNLRNLRWFYASNNSLVTLPPSMFDHPYLARLTVDGNQLTALPSNIGNVRKTLKLFGATRNNLTSFPDSFSQLSKLNVLDIRNNSFESLPAWNELSTLHHMTVAGNPLCRNGWVGTGRVKDLMEKEGEGCTRQCSDMCLNTYLSNAGCDPACNVPECNYDNKKCTLN
eukprot:g6193.t1